MKADDGSPHASLRHILTDGNRQIDPQAADAAMDWTSQLQAATATAEAAAMEGELDDQQQPTAMTSTYRRNANGSVSSVFSGNRIRYLKKEDGHPLWRKDIQYLFLRMVFEDENKVFTRMSDGSTGHTFADIYIDAMAKSSKTSQILKDKLLSDRDSALQMAMICLLVNVGRMNTTLNCKLCCASLNSIILLILGSLSGNASSCSNLPCYPMPSGAIWHPGIQTASGWTPTQVDSEGRHGRCTTTW